MNQDIETTKKTMFDGLYQHQHTMITTANDKFYIDYETNPNDRITRDKLFKAGAVESSFTLPNYPVPFDTLEEAVVAKNLFDEMITNDIMYGINFKYRTRVL